MTELFGFPFYLRVSASPIISAFKEGQKERWKGRGEWGGKGDKEREGRKMLVGKEPKPK